MTNLRRTLWNVHLDFCQHSWHLKNMHQWQKRTMITTVGTFTTTSSSSSSRCQLQDSLVFAKPRIRKVPSLCRRWYGSKSTRNTTNINHTKINDNLPPAHSSQFRPTAYTQFQMALLREQIHRMRDLIDETTTPPGSFKEKHFIHARVAFKLLKKTSNLFLEMEDAPQILNLIFDVMERLAKEFPYHNQPKPPSPIHYTTHGPFTDDEMDDNTDDEDDDEDHRNHHRKRREGATLCFQYQWLLGHTQVPHYVHIWKKLALEGYPVYRARALLSKIQSMALHFPDFQHNIKVYGVIMGVLMKQEDPQTAPDWAEQIFQYVQDQGTHRCRPDIFLYNQVIQSWAAASERVEAAGKISEWYVRMRQNNSKDACCVRPDIVTFSVLLRFWGRMVDTYQLDCLLRDMKKDHIVPDIICLNGAIYGYATAGKIDKARDLLQQMVPLRPENRSQMRMISEGAQMILLACRDKIKNWNNDDLTINRKTELDQMIKEAEAVFQLVADKVDRPARDGLFCTLVDVYIRARNDEKFESVRHELSPSNKIHLALWMKYYVRRGQTENAISLLRERLQVDPTKVDLDMFHTLINELSKSTNSTAYEQASQVIALINESANVEADNSTYICLLRCLLNSKVDGAGKIALEILSDIDQRASMATKTPLNSDDILVAFTMALNIALDSGDTDSGEKLLDWMNQSEYMISTRVYNVILRILAQRCSIAAARKAEKLLDSMKNRKGTSVQPDVESYASVMDAWVCSGVHYACKRILLIYQRMLADKINPNLATYNALIESLSASRTPEMLQKAESILDNLEDSLLPYVQPNSKHYSSIMKGWIYLGDALSAQRLMERQIKFHIKNRSRRSRPIPAHYQAIIKAFTMTGDLAGATGLLDKIQLLKDEGMLPQGPSIESYEYLKQAWSASKEPDRDYQVSRIDAILKRN